MAITAPSDISGLVLDLDPHEASYQDTAGTTPAGAGDSVARVDDQTAGAEHVTQATAANRPTLQADLNGWLYLLFDGSNDYLNNTTFDAGSQPFEIVTVAMHGNVSGNDMFWANGSGVNAGRNEVGGYNLSWGGTKIDSGPAVDGNLHVVNWSINGASSLLEVDNANQQTATLSTASWSAAGAVGFNLGRYSGGNYFTGRQYRVLIYGKQLTPTERTDLYDYLNALYASAPPGEGNSVAADSGSYALTGSAASLEKGWKTPVDAGSYGVTGSTANLLKGYTLTAESGSYAVTGQTAALTKQWEVSAQAGSYTLIGAAASLEKGWELSAEAGSYTLTGSAAILTASGEDPTLTAEAGSYSLSGQAAGLTKQWAVSAEAGSYSLTGGEATLRRNATLSAESGSYNLSGSAAILTKQWVLSALSGGYVLTGSTTILDWSGEIVPDVIFVSNVQISLPSAQSVSLSIPSVSGVQLVE